MVNKKQRSKVRVKTNNNNNNKKKKNNNNKVYVGFIVSLYHFPLVSSVVSFLQKVCAQVPVNSLED